MTQAAVRQRVVDPVEFIGRTETRLVRLAVLQSMVIGVPAVLFTLALGLIVVIAAPLVWQNFGLAIDPARQALLRDGILIAALLEAFALAIFAWSRGREARDFEDAARRIDDRVQARQEILTLASIANPRHPVAADQRSPLFAMLWRRASGYLENFNPRKEFRLRLAEPLARASMGVLLSLMVVAIAFAALLRRPSATQAAALRLRQFADNASSAGANVADHQLAQAARDVARDLENPHLPPQQKLAELQAIRREIEKFEQRKSSQSGSGNTNGTGKGEGKGSGGGNGTGSGQGNGGSGEGSGTGTSGKGAKSDAQSMALHNDVNKAEAKLEEESSAGEQSKTAQNQGKNGSGIVPQQGSNPNQAGPQSKPNGTGNVPIQEPGRLAESGAQPSPGDAAAPKNDKGSQGDTHLGDFPKAVSYERFYKLGEKGPPIDIKDARYVTFRLPTSVVAKGNEGRLVHDSGAPSATTPYTNAPLKEQRLTASPDEEQLVPPRYRELIR